MTSSYRFALRPRWIAWHLLCIALCITMIMLGRWQLTVSEHKHFSLQNFGYALQWWAFTAFTAWMWFKILRDNSQAAMSGEAHTTPAESAARESAPVAYRRYVMPKLADQPAAQDDPQLAAYNDYLAQLAQDDEGRS